MKKPKVKKLILSIAFTITAGVFLFSALAYADIDFGAYSTEETFIVHVGSNYSWWVDNYSNRPDWIQSISPTSIRVGFFNDPVDATITVVADRSTISLPGEHSWEMRTALRWSSLPPTYSYSMIRITVPWNPDQFGNTDLNGDGAMETFEMEPVYTYGSYKDRISVYDGNNPSPASPIWEHTFYTDFNPDHEPIFQDLDGDGDVEIIMMDQIYQNQKLKDKIVVYDYSGFKGEHIFYGDFDPDHDPVFQDLDGDGGVEIVLMDQKYEFQKLKDKLVVCTYNGSQVGNWSYTFYGDFDPDHEPVFKDLDGNGGVEIVLMDQKFEFQKLKDKLVVCNYNGSQFGYWEHIFYGDFDPDATLLFVDIDRNGGKEIIFMDQKYEYQRLKDKIVVCDSAGYKWEHVQYTDFDPDIMPAFADMDGNEGLEVVVLDQYYQYSSVHNKIWAWSFNKSQVVAQEISGSSLTGSPVIKDDNGNWQLEVYMSGTQVYESPHTSTNKNPWPYEPSDLEYTGEYNSHNIFVHVEYDTGAPAAGATIWLGPNQRTADANGNYTLDVCDGDYTVEAAAPGYSQQSQNVTVSGDDVTVDFDNFTTYSIRGTILYGDDTPVGGVTVTAAGRFGISNGATGAYEITGVPNGAHEVEPSMGDYGFDPTSHTSVQVNNGPTVGIDFSTYIISGRVVDYDTGVGITGIDVTIEKAGPPPALIETIPTFTGGTYERKGLGSGDYNVVVETYSGHEFVAEYPAGTYDPYSQSQRVTLNSFRKDEYIKFTAVGPPVADFYANPAGGVVSFTANFDSSASTGDIEAYSWDFGDPYCIPADNTSDQPDPAHTYNSSDNYTVTLNLTGPFGIVDQTGRSEITNQGNPIIVNSPPQAIIDANKTKVNVGERLELDGSRSNDYLDGGTIDWESSSWSQEGPVEWPIIEYRDGNKWQPTYEAPDIRTQGTISTNFILTTYDHDSPTPNSDTTYKAITINRSPTAEAGDNETVNIGAPPITLDGSSSTDPDDPVSNPGGDIIRYEWSKPGGTPGTITDDDITTPQATFNVPAAISSRSTQVEVTLTVTDTNGLTHSDPITITINNRPPTVDPIVQDAPLVQDKYIVYESTQAVQLRANASDPDGTIPSCLWSANWNWGSLPEVTLSNPNSANPTFNAPTGIFKQGDAIVTFTLTVTDEVTTDPVTESIQVKINRPPTAEAGDNEVVNIDAPPITLDGSSSTDPDDPVGSPGADIIRYEWSKPGGTPGTITDDDITTPQATFNVPAAISSRSTQVEVTLTVTDTNGLTHSDPITITINNRPPTANPIVENAPFFIDGRYIMHEGTNGVQLRANASEPDGTTPSYTWSANWNWGSLPEVTPSNPNSADPTFNAPTGIFKQGDAIVTFTLTITDEVITDPVTESIQVKINRKPNANPGIPPTVNVDASPITLDASGSSDLDSPAGSPRADIVTYEWMKESGPGTIIDDDTSTPQATFTPPVSVPPTNVLIQTEVNLTVTDIYGLPDTVELPEPPFKITINRKPTAVTVIDKTVVNEVGDSVRFDGTGSYDPDNGITFYTWTVVPNLYEIDEGNLSANGQEPYPEVVKFTPIEGIQNPGDPGPINVQFELTVVGNTGDASLDSSDPVSTPMITINRRPVASARADKYVVEEGGQVELIGTDSDDPDGVTIEYHHWQETTGLAGIDILNPYSANTRVEISEGITDGNPILATFTLTVTDIAGGLSHTSGEVEITINPPPDILYVGPSRTYTTIQSAIDDAADGYTIQVDPGSYKEDVTLIDGITLQSAEWEDASAVILPDTTYIEGQVTMANNTELLGFRISRADSTVTPNATEALVNVGSVSDVTIAYNVIKAEAYSEDGTLCALKLEELTTAAADDMENINIHNNVIQSNALGTDSIALGLAIIQLETDESFPHNIEIVNNTIDAISYGKAYGLYIDANTAYNDSTFESEKIIVINDIVTIAPSKGGLPPNYCIYKNEGRDTTIPLPPGCNSYNLPVKYSNLYMVKSAFLDEEYSVYIDIRPQFQNQLGEDPQYIDEDPDLHLRVKNTIPYENSPCIDAGIRSGKYADYLSEPPAFSVFVNDFVNMGAYGNTYEAALRREGEAASATGFNTSEEDIPEADILRLTGSGYDPDGDEKDLRYRWYSEKDGAETLIGEGDPGVNQLDYDQLSMGSHTLSMRLIDSNDKISKPSKAIPVKVGYPSELAATFAATPIGDYFLLSWQDNSISEDRFKILRRKSGESAWDDRGFVGGSYEKGQVTWFEPAPTDDTYYYKVEAVEPPMEAMEAQFEVEMASSPDEGGISSNIVQVKPDIVETPYAPHNLDVRFLTDISFSTKIELSWQQDETIPTVPRVDHYKIYSSINDPSLLDDLSRLTPAITTATSYDDQQDISTIGTYYYRVVSHNAAGDSTPSDMVEIVRGANIRPTLRIVFPLSGSELVGLVDIELTAYDHEGDPLLIKLEYKKGDDEWIVIDSFVTSNIFELYPWDTSVLPRGGDYSLKVTAVDINTAPYSEYVVEDLIVNSNKIAVSDMQTLRSALNEANDGDIILLKPGLYTVDEPSVKQTFSSSISVVYNFGLMINKNITLKAINPNRDNTVISLGSRSISIMDPRYYAGGHAYYNTYSHNNGFTNVNDVTIEGITITGTSKGSQMVRVWIVDRIVQTGYGASREEGHWASFSESDITSPIFNFSEKLTLKNCNILATSDSGHSVYTWRGNRYVNTEVILDNTYLEGDIENDGYMCGDAPGIRYIWLF